MNGRRPNGGSRSDEIGRARVGEGRRLDVHEQAGAIGQSRIDRQAHGTRPAQIVQLRKPACLARHGKEGARLRERAVLGPTRQGFVGDDEPAVDVDDRLEERGDEPAVEHSREFSFELGPAGAARGSRLRGGWD